MTEPMYKKGNTFAWIGLFLALAAEFLGYLGTPSTATTNNTLFVSSLEPFILLFMIVSWMGIALLLWGSVLALKSKNRSLWWLLLFLLSLLGFGIIFVAIIFMLPDRSVTGSVVSYVPPPSPANNQPAQPNT